MVCIISWSATGLAVPGTPLKSFSYSHSDSSIRQLLLSLAVGHNHWYCFWSSSLRNAIGMPWSRSFDCLRPCHRLLFIITFDLPRLLCYQYDYFHFHSVSLSLNLNSSSSKARHSAIFSFFIEGFEVRSKCYLLFWNFPVSWPNEPG